MDILTLTAPLTCLSIGLGITSLVLPKWNCGGFFTTCTFTLVHLIIMAFIIGGMALISIVFFADICSACNTKWVPGPVCASYKIIIFAFGAASLMAGNLLYALMFVKSWSFLLSFSSSIVAVHVVLFAIFGSKCFRHN
ncbi:unnamed protein product [Taenia asiatica]|uniref:MARVEL domain-containing protein n=1 Tax=Taenia asiatica TaxID=60517 RepID=A0A0R3WBG1_TAEAS|nr:unnamed protein product [Taenia asiatica]